MGSFTRRVRTGIVWTAFFAVSGTVAAWASDGQDTMFLDRTAERGSHNEVQELVLDREEFEVTPLNPGLGELTLAGAYFRQGWTLLIRAEPVRRDSEGRFTLQVRVGPGDQALLFRAVGPKGEIESRWVVLRRVAAQAPVLEPVAKKEPEPVRDDSEDSGWKFLELPWRIRALLGAGQNSLVQTGLSAKRLSKTIEGEVRGGVYWENGSSHEISVHYGLSVFDFGSSPAGTNLLDRRSSVQGAYRFWRDGPWGARGVLGLRMQSMATGGGNVGFRNATMPMLYPELMYQFKGWQLRGSARYSPLFSGLSIKSSTDYDLGGRVAVEWLRSSSRLNWVELEYNHIQVSSTLSLLKYSAVRVLFGWEF